MRDKKDWSELIRELHKHQKNNKKMRIDEKIIESMESNTDEVGRPLSNNNENYRYYTYIGNNRYLPLNEYNPLGRLY
jgi:hypothetical protein